jgi:hypothetical protein
MIKIMSDTLKEVLLRNRLCLSQDLNGTDKEFPKMYISEIYEPIISKLRRKTFNFVEIGVRTGASVHLWSKYFESMNFIGIDNEVDVVWQNADWLQGKNVKYMKADAYQLETLRKLPNELDLVIDDGPHSISSQIWLAQNYTSILSGDGLIFIEDIQGGLRYCDRIVRAVPKTFKGCVRVLDLRKMSGQGDALVVLIHNCDGICQIDNKFQNQFEVWPSVLRFLYFEQIRFVFNRVAAKVMSIFK